MQTIEPLQFDKYYHIYNQGVNNTNLFKTADNYEYFLTLYDKHITPISETIVWCLMPNHFHLLVKIKPLTGFETLSGMDDNNKIKPPHQYFSNLFNAYTQAFNKMYKRRGVLFQRPFKRKLIDNERYFINLVLYIHNNPVHHGFVENAIEWGWSSCLTCLSTKPTKVEREFILEQFGGLENFKNMTENYNTRNDCELFGDI